MLTITANDLPRYMICDGYVNMPVIKNIDEENKTKEEGIASHWFIEQVFNKRFTPSELIDRKCPENGYWITPEIAEHAEEYINSLDPTGSVEIDTTFSDGQHFQINARADYICKTGSKLFVKDYKYGWVIKEPEENWTLLFHAMSYLIKNQISDVTEVIFEIYQPRAFHVLGPVRTWKVSIQDLWNVYYTKLINKLTNPENTLVTSDHCYRCLSAALCPANQKANNRALEISEKVFQSELTDQALSFMLAETERAIKILKTTQKAYEEDAQHRMRKGQVVQGYMLKMGQSNVKWNEGVTPEFVETMIGRQVSTKKLPTPTQLINDGVDENFVKSISGRQNTGVKLVKIKAEQAAQNVFKTRKEN